MKDVRDVVVDAIIETKQQHKWFENVVSIVGDDLLFILKEDPNIGIGELFYECKCAVEKLGKSVADLTERQERCSWDDKESQRKILVRQLCKQALLVNVRNACQTILLEHGVSPDEL